MKIVTTAIIQLNGLPGLMQQCITSIKTVLEAFINLPESIMRRIPSLEWTRLINAIVCIFSVLQTASPHDLVELDRFGPLLEALHMRFTNLCSDNSNPADRSEQSPWQRGEKFRLWAAVLGIVREKYTRMVEEGSLISLTSMCPALGSDIRQTEYWDFVEEANAGVQYFDYPTPGDSKTGSSA
jgi:hypothetical protein